MLTISQRMRTYTHTKGVRAKEPTVENMATAEKLNEHAYKLYAALKPGSPKILK